MTTTFKTKQITFFKRTKQIVKTRAVINFKKNTVVWDCF